MTAASTAFIPLRLLLDSLDGTLAAGYGGDGLLDRIGISDYALSADDLATTAHLTLAIDEEVGFTLPGSDDLGLFVGGTGTLRQVHVVAELAADGVTVSIASLDAVIRFGSLLRPAVRVADRWEAAPGTVDLPLAGVGIVVQPDGDVVITEASGREVALSLSPTMIGETGIVVEAESVTLLLGSTAGGGSLPRGAPPGFRGLHLVGVRVHLPDTLDAILPDGIALEEAWIGAGGFTGSVSFDWDADAPSGADPAGRLGGLAFQLSGVDLEIVQNVPTACSVAGRLTVPFLDVVVDVEVAVGLDGRFSVAVSGAQGDGVGGEIPGLGSVEIQALAITIGDPSSVTVCGTLHPTIGAPGIDWPAVALESLTIGADGTVRLDGGWLDLSEPLALSLSGFAVDLTRIGFGQDGEWRWIGLSGGIRLVELLPTGVSADGLRLRWTPDGRSDLTLDGVGLTATLPGLAALSGAVAMRDDGLGGRRFDGTLSLTLLALDVSVDAAVVIGVNPTTGTYFMASLAVELPIGIPLWASGTALYGLGALVAIDMAPTVAEGDWYGWYSASPQPFDVAAPHRWSPQRGAVAVGAGIVLGTVFDGGWAVSTKSMLAVAVPGPTVLINGTADVLQVRPELGAGSQGTFAALAVLDGAAGSLLLTLDAGWSVPYLVDVAGSAGAFFDVNDPAQWWVHLGEAQPASARVRADLLSLFDADAYLAADRTGLVLGGSASFGDSWTFGPVRLTLRSWAEVAAGITWQPVHATGEVSIGGQYELSVAGIGLGIAAEATLSGSAPTPWAVEGSLHVVIKLPTPIKDLDETIRLSWREPAVPALADPFDRVSLTTPVSTATWDASQDLAGSPLVPLDCRPTLVFNRSVADETGLGTATAHHPGPVDVGTYAVDYVLDSVTLEQQARVDGVTTWVPADVDLAGVWQLMENDAGALVDTRLMIWGDTPLDFTRNSSQLYGDGLLAAHPGEPCGTPPSPRMVCVNAATWPLDRVFEGGLASDLGELLLPWPTRATTIPVSLSGTSVALRVDTSGSGDGAGPGEATMWVRPADAFDRVAALVRAVTGDVTARVWRDGEVLAEEVVPSSQVALVDLEVDAGTWLQLTGPQFDVAEICVLTHESNAAVLAFQERRSALVALTEQWSTLRPVLAPQTAYRLTVRTSGSRAGGADPDEQSWTTTAHFHTGGPPGAAAPWDAELPSVTFGAYVEATVPDLDAPAHYPAYDLGALFTTADVEAMFAGDLRLQIRDRNGQFVTGPDGRPLLAWNTWGTRPVTALSGYQVPYAEQATACLPASVAPVQAPTLTLAPDLLLDITFDDTRWSAQLVPVMDVSASDWQVRDGALHQDGDPRPGALVSQERFTGGLAVEVDVTVVSGAFAVVFGYLDDATSARFVIDPVGTGQARVEAVADGVPTVLWSGAVSAQPGTPLGVRVQVEGGRVRALVDDVLLVDEVLLTDAVLPAEPDVPAVQPAAVGFGTWGTVDVAVDRIRVARWPGGVLETSSRYDAELVGACLLAQASTLDPLPHGWQQDGDLTLTGLAGQWQDVRAQADLRADAGSGPIAVVARHSNDGGEHVRFVLHPATGRRSLVVRSSGSDATVWSDLGYHAGDVQSVTLDVVGDQVTITQASDVLASLALNGAVRGPGRAGLEWAIEGGRSAENVTIWTSPRAVVHHWPFTTSSAPDLVHLLDSFVGTLYRQDIAVTGQGSAAVTAWLDRVRDAAGPDLAEQAPSLFADGGAVLGLGYSPTPPVVEMTALQEAGGARASALLLELPEPLAWNRVRLRGSVDGAAFTPIAVWSGDGTKALLVGSSGANRLSPGRYVVDLVLDLDAGPQAPIWQRAASTRPEVARLAFTLD